MPFNCEFSSAFSTAFAICSSEPAPSVVPTLRGVPSIPRPRRRPEVVEVSGECYVSVIGAGALTGEAALRSRLDVASEGYGALVREALRVLVAAIRSGAESLACGELASGAVLVLATGGVGAVCGELGVAGSGAYAVDAYARMTSECFASARARVRSGGEAAIVRYENDETVILAAAAWLRRYLTQRRRRA